MKYVIATKGVSWPVTDWTYWATKPHTRWARHRSEATPIDKCLADRLVENYRNSPDWDYSVEVVR